MVNGNSWANLIFLLPVSYHSDQGSSILLIATKTKTSNKQQEKTMSMWQQKDETWTSYFGFITADLDMKGLVNSFKRNLPVPLPPPRLFSQQVSQFTTKLIYHHVRFVKETVYSSSKNPRKS